MRRGRLALVLAPALRLSLSLALGGLLPIAFAPRPAGAEPDVASLVRARQARTWEIARQLWRYAELGYREERSAALLQEELRRAGFAVEAGVAGLPTAFVASAGGGRPVVVILAEYDALPGLSQAASPRREPLLDSGPGHACGHNLFGAGSVSAAIAVRSWLEESGLSGTLRLYGTPAEEGGSGKVYMVRAGLFDDVDAVLHWHPSDRNDASPFATLANKSAKFRFHGEAAHAASAPERGRSALDGVEAMNHMVNLLREHVPESSRIHYVITEGGSAPNVVPERAEVFYYVRHPDPELLDHIWTRVDAAARGAALGTGTRVESEIIHGNHSILPNETLARRVDAHLRRVGGPRWGEAERRFAAELRASLPADAPPPGSEAEIRPYAPELWKASSDVGDVSWVVPTAGLRVATWVPGTAAHSWQAVAASGSPVGDAGVRIAAQVLALTARDLLRDPEIVARAREELERRRGPEFRYRPLLGDREPPLDYRQGEVVSPH